jgi:hypothetical protein
VAAQVPGVPVLLWTWMKLPRFGRNSTRSPASPIAFHVSIFHKAGSTLPSLAAAFRGSLLAGPQAGDFPVDGFPFAGELPDLHRLGQAFGKALLDVLEFLHRPIRVPSHRATSTGVPIKESGSKLDDSIDRWVR